MTYKLAKQLKDAGFPQEGNDRHCHHTEPDPACKGDCEPSCICYFPTLSELIEACGDGNFTLSGMETGWYANKGLVKKAGIETWAKTPEEAVAKLWLELSKKP